MSKLYGSIIIFFHFVKYPIFIFLPILYIIFNYPPNIILDTLWLISSILILIDRLYSKPKECYMKKNIISKVVSLQIGKIRTIHDDTLKKKEWTTGSYKEKTNSIKNVYFDGIEGDEVSDTTNHGGKDKAVFANSYENYPTWEKYLNKQKLDFGALAENLTLNKIKEEDVCIGDIHKIGTTVLEVSQPREPCWKISKKHNNKLFTKYIYDSNRTGWYYRVLEEGQIKKNNNVELLKRVKDPITIFKANQSLKDTNTYAETAKRLVQLDVLGEPFRKSLLAKIHDT